MVAVVDVADTVAESTAVEPRRRPWGTVGLFFGLAVLYFVTGAVLAVRYNLFEWDGVSRTAAAGYSVMSRYPHLAAVGFVWNPLPTLLQIPLMPLSNLWPELKTYGLAGAIQSALFSAGSVLLVRQFALDRGVGRMWRWAAIACMALHPMVLVYAGSGMSEPAELFCLIWAALYLTRWVESHRVGDLTGAAIALAAGYLTRYEVGVAVIGAALLVAGLSLRHGPRKSRLNLAIVNSLIVVFPAAAVFVVWAVAGWILDGKLFATLTSQYGNASQVETARERGGLLEDGNVMVIAERVFGMQPLVGISVIVALVLIVLYHRKAPLVPLALFLPVLFFSAWGHYTGSTYSLFRYYMPAIPLVILIALACWPKPGRQDLPEERPRSAPVGAAILAVSLCICLPVTAKSMLAENNSGQQLLLGVNSLLHPDEHPPGESWYRRAGLGDRLVAHYFDNKHLPPSSVLTDTFISAVVWLESENPQQFVITSDYDFTAALNRPWDFGVQYILISDPAGNAAPDAITTRYPSLWEDGAGIGTLVHSVKGPSGQERWRIYRVLKPEESVVGR